MDKGTEILKQLLEEFKNLSTEEYLELDRIASEREHIRFRTELHCYDRLWNSLVGELENFSNNSFHVVNSNEFDYKQVYPNMKIFNISTTFDFSYCNPVKLAA